jgi:hypothetical protein
MLPVTYTFSPYTVVTVGAKLIVTDVAVGEVVVVVGVLPVPVAPV